MVRIILNLEYCNGCGDCCLLDCKSEYYERQTCTHPEKSKQCEMFPISYLNNKFYLKQCKGVAFELLPLKLLNEIIERLNNGEHQFEVKTEELHCKVSR